MRFLLINYLENDDLGNDRNRLKPKLLVPGGGVYSTVLKGCRKVPLISGKCKIDAGLGVITPL